MILQTLYFESLKGSPSTPPPVLEEPDNQLFDWTFSDDGSDYTSFPGISPKRTISLAVSGNSYKHHIYGEELLGRLYCMHSNHPSDEEGIGMKVVYEYSDDDGVTWTGELELFPEQSTVDDRIGNTGRIVIPMDFANINGELFAVADVNYRDFVTVPNIRTGLGIIARQIFPNGTLGDIFWIHNADGSTNPVAPVSGFPQYQYSSEIRAKVYAYLDRPNYRPKTNFSDPELSIVDIPHPTYGTLAEPVTIKPYGYSKLYTYWKNNNRGFKIEQIDDSEEFGVSEIPDATAAIVTRFHQYDNETILISGNANVGNRGMLFFAITKRREVDGVYVTQNVYIIDHIANTSQDFPGHGKGGGPQIVDMLVRGNKVYFFYDIKKEHVYMKSATINA